MHDLTAEEFIHILNGMIQNPYMGIIIVDKDGFIRIINQTYLDILGMKEEDVLGRHVLEVTPHSKLLDVLKTGEVHLADHWPVNGHDTIVARMPIEKDGEIIGAIGKSLFLDISGARTLTRKLQQMERELNIYKEEVRQSYQAKWQFCDIVGRNPAFNTVLQIAQQLSHTTSTVLITGESGTGKELFAHSIHNASARQSQPFVRVNCAALPDNLLESELFGYEEGAFTGARKGGKPGKFELANGGTIFLDEIGDMPLSMQTELLTVLQEREVERIGGTNPIPVNVRIIAATNRDLEEMVNRREFREDLFYRLNVVRLVIPPLRERLDDIPFLVGDLMARINRRLNTRVATISDEAMQLLLSHHWPGNVRELENLVERAMILADMNDEPKLLLKHFPSLAPETVTESGEDSRMGLTEALERMEKRMIQQALEQAGGVKSQAAKLLGIHCSALYRKLEKYGL